MSLEEYTKELEKRYRDTIDYKDDQETYWQSQDKLEPSKRNSIPFIKTHHFRHQFERWCVKERYLHPNDFSKLVHVITPAGLILVLKHLGLTAT